MSERGNGLVGALEHLIFDNRRVVIALFSLITAFMLYLAITGLRIDTSFTKLLPLEHPYMQTYLKHQQEFGGANRLLIAVVARDGDMFTPEFFEALKIATDEVFFIEGVDRSRVSSLFTPDVRYTEVVEGGIEAGNVIPADFQPTPEGLAQVRENILKAGIVGRLVAKDFSGAIVSASLLDADPETGKPIDYIRVAEQLEENVRQKIESAFANVQVDGGTDLIDVHMIGFAKVVHDIAAGALSVVAFAIATLVLTTLLVWIYGQTFRVAVAVVACSTTAVIWQLGILVLLGYGIDPLGILVPFLIFAIGVSHGVQMISVIREQVFEHLDTERACRTAFRRLLVPGGIALASDLVGFITILFIKVEVIQEMAITASLGVAVIILTNLVLLPVLVSFLRFDDAYRQKLMVRARQLKPIWLTLSKLAHRGPATVVIVVAAVLAVIGYAVGRDVKIGDLQRGVPELRPESQYNLDTAVITDKFSIGVDIINVIVETIPNGCVDYEIMRGIDQFAWHMRNVEGVQEVVTLPGVAKIVASGWNEGSLKWRTLPRDETSLVQSVKYVETSTGLLNRDCDVMPVIIFTEDHKAETITRVTDAVKAYTAEHEVPNVEFRLATGNVGVMAATNEEVSRAQFPILLGIFGAVIVMVLLTFRSPRAVVCIVLPLAIVSLLAYALMVVLQIGLKVSTLPVVALGAGIGVDYGIYIFARLRQLLEEEPTFEAAYEHTLRVTGAGVIATGITLAIGVATWIFSPLQFQADVGVLLTFMFLVNMLGAILLLPALAVWLFGGRKRATAAA
ncbi:MAG TPA: MMPL family transporter [Steroidobacteraceae bacterium]|nr:MMPL family transporter [Steroidobacteraceae bacterium]